MKKFIFIAFFMIISAAIVISMSDADFFKLRKPQSFDEYYSSGEPSETSSEDVIETPEELKEKIYELGEARTSSEKIKLRSLDIWEAVNSDNLNNSENLDKISIYGIEGLSITYVEQANYLEAEIFIKYEMFMNIIIAHDLSQSAELSESAELSKLTYQEQQVYNKAKAITDTLTNPDRYEHEMTDFDVSLAIYNYLIANIDYDFDYVDNPDSFNVYGALIDGKAVCKGYTQSYKMLLHLAGIDSMIVTGYAGGEKHSWNLVNYGGKWLHADATWGEVEVRQSDVSHKFFNVGDSLISATHQWKKELYPAADKPTENHNYYKRRGCAADSPESLEVVFYGLYGAGYDFIEILCEFEASEQDLLFVNDFGIADSIMYSFEEYGDYIMLTILL